MYVPPPQLAIDIQSLQSRRVSTYTAKVPKPLPFFADKFGKLVRTTAIPGPVPTPDQRLNSFIDQHPEVHTLIKSILSTAALHPLNPNIPQKWQDVTALPGTIIIHFIRWHSNIHIIRA